MGATIVRFEVSGREVEVLASPLATLQGVLRNQLGYTSVKDGCRQGGCGSCTVLVDGEPMLSCLLPVEDVAGRRVTTLEGLTPAEGAARVCAPRPQPVAHPRRDRRGALGQHLPLHWLHPDHRRDRGGRRPA